MNWKNEYGTNAREPEHSILSLFPRWGKCFRGMQPATELSCFAAHFGKETLSFYRAAQDVFVSSIGIGTYRGAMDNKTDAAYVAAVHAALQAGVNLIDTSLNYRHERSERNVGVGVHLF